MKKRTQAVLSIDSFSSAIYTPQLGAILAVDGKNNSLIAINPLTSGISTVFADVPGIPNFGAGVYDTNAKVTLHPLRLFLVLDLLTHLLSASSIPLLFSLRSLPPSFFLLTIFTSVFISPPLSSSSSSPS